MERNPENSIYQSSLAQSYRVEMIRARFDRADDAEQNASRSALRAIEILEGLTENYPDDPQYRYELADMFCLSVRFQPDLGSEEEARRVEEAAEICAELTRRYPQVSSYQALAATTDRRMASIERRNGNLDETVRHHRIAVDTYEELTQRFPTVSLYPIAWAQTLSEMADALLEGGDRDGALEHARSAVEVAESCEPLRGDDRVFQRFLQRLTQKRDHLARTLPFRPAGETSRDP